MDSSVVSLSRKRPREDLEDEFETKHFLEQIQNRLDNIQLRLDEIEKNDGDSVHDETEILKLNVGGKKFEVKKDLLMGEESMLSIMFSGRYPVTKDENGSVYIDRDPTLFPYVLNYLRDKENAIIDCGEDLEEALINEVDYYQLLGMARLLRGKLARDRMLGPDNVRLLKEENTARELFLNLDLTYVKNHPYELLIDVFDPIFFPTFCHPEGEGDHGNFPLMFSKNRKIFPGKRSICPSLEVFKQQFNSMTCFMFKDMDWSNVFVAGGVTLGSLLPIPDDYAPPPYTRQERRYKNSIYGEDQLHYDKDRSRDRTWCYYNGVKSAWFSPTRGDSGQRTKFVNSDIDVFIYGLDAAATYQKILHIQDVLQKNVGSLLYVRTSRTITFVSGWPRRHVQVILRLYQSPAEILLGFDVDCVGVGYNGDRVFCLPRARRAINYRYNIADPSRQTYRTNSYEYRLWKYSRRGFAVAVPGLVRNKINPNIYTKSYADLKGKRKSSGG
eukprot:TRINITY_DN11316_c0_g1_i8.p1 TRINITY_DN11316_c0_g1~~TRINITY_DN11316_c0_g1_i8.p1  ORF type:complete len:499 (-),score=83.56 TRINITY_DN11316_c0_g1_i8:502-1998(-)